MKKREGLIVVATIANPTSRVFLFVAYVAFLVFLGGRCVVGRRDWASELKDVIADVEGDLTAANVDVEGLVHHLTDHLLSRVIQVKNILDGCDLPCCSAATSVVRITTKTKETIREISSKGDFTRTAFYSLMILRCFLEQKLIYRI